MLNVLPPRGAARWRAGLALLAAVWFCTPAHAQAGAGGIGAVIGLGAALLALLAIQGSTNAAMPVGGLGVVLLALLSVGVLSSQWRRLRRPPAPRAALLAQAAPSERGDARLVADARHQFLALQAAWDRADLDALGRLTTPEMLGELIAQLPQRGPGPNRTDVLSLDAHVLRVERLGPIELASIEFCGLVRESETRGPVPFHELWMLARSDAAEPWRLARQQALM